jgi:hypothetical protein
MTDPRIADHIIALAADPALRPHPEETCERCGGLNVLSWHAPSPLWNAVLRDPVTREDRWSIICPRCFAELAEESVVGSSAGWHWAPCGEPLPEWDMGDGRIWDPERCLWVGGSVPPLVGDAGADRPRSTGPGVSTSQQTLAEALQAILDDVSDVRRGMIVLAPDLAADAILATDPGSRLTVSESQKLSDSSDPDAERQRAIGEAVERLDNATLPSTSLEIQKPSDWTLGLGQTDRKDWLVNVWDGSDSLATALGRDLVEMIDRVIASLSKSSCDCPSFDAEAERDCCCVGGEACRPAAALPAAQEPER